MLGQDPLISASIAAALALVLSSWWFGVHLRRRVEMASGIATLAAMKWRECLGLVLQSMAKQGYVEEPSSHQPGDGGSEYLLRKGDSTCLLSYKHGTAYRLGEANVREFANAVRLQGANRGMLVTLGSSESFAREVAHRYEIELLDGAAIWPRVRGFVPEDAMARIRSHAAAETRRGLAWGVLASALIGASTGVALTQLNPVPSESSSKATLPVATPTPAPAEHAASERLTESSVHEAQVAVQALEKVAALTDAERAARRVAAAASVAKIERVRSALWSTQSTLVLSLSRTQAEEQDLIAEACRILVQYEEMRYSRLQLEPPEGSDTPVRWRQCQ